ncbi:MAG: class I tRNA ligase family protein, partial [Candidatus Diapherotrites archaeon]
SAGNVVDPLEIARKYNIDSVRYYLIRETPFGEDGFFSETKLVERSNTELANDLGNFANRVLALISQKKNSCIPKGKLDASITKKLDIEKIKKHFENFELHLALAEIMNFVKQCNQYINEKEPWKKDGEELNDILYTLAELLRAMAILLYPFIPSSSEKIAASLGTKIECLDDIFSKKGVEGKKVESQCILFQKIKP